ncbi:hypothetical protein IWX46DRAFT_274014 [Phyllosticta citricarpa]|uniref:Uncharacterized protein n=1 Tax=Phyllosticta citricarpa TaxID=55181 RepID=A0ABR1LK26_9PEZI
MTATCFFGRCSVMLSTQRGSGMRGRKNGYEADVCAPCLEGPLLESFVNAVQYLQARCLRRRLVPLRKLPTRCPQEADASSPLRPPSCPRAACQLPLVLPCRGVQTQRPPSRHIKDAAMMMMMMMMMMAAVDNSLSSPSTHKPLRSIPSVPPTRNTLPPLHAATACSGCGLQQLGQRHVHGSPLVASRLFFPSLSSLFNARAVHDMAMYGMQADRQPTPHTTHGTAWRPSINRFIHTLFSPLFSPRLVQCKRGSLSLTRHGRARTNGRDREGSENTWTVPSFCYAIRHPGSSPACMHMPARQRIALSDDANIILLPTISSSIIMAQPHEPQGPGGASWRALR